MALYIPHSIFHLAWLLYVRPETFGPYYVWWVNDGLPAAWEAAHVQFLRRSSCSRPFLGASVKVRKATTGFVKVQLGSHYTDFREILHCKHSLKSKEKSNVRLNTDKNIIHVTWRLKWYMYVKRDAFPRQPCLRERASMLRLYVHCLSCCIVTVNNIKFFLKKPKHFSPFHPQSQSVLVHGINVHWRNSYNHTILILGTKWRWVVNFTLRPPYPLERTQVPTE